MSGDSKEIMAFGSLADPQKHSDGVSIVIPVYNSAKFLRDIVLEVEGFAHDVGLAFEVILVDDGSRDESWQEICQLANEFHEVSGIRLHKNAGQHHALAIGAKKARFPLLVTLDDDAQQIPHDILNLLSVLKADSLDLVYGKPGTPTQSSLRAWIGRAFRRAVANLSGVETYLKQSNFRLLRTELLSSYGGEFGQKTQIDAYLLSMTDRVDVVKVGHRLSLRGGSRYNLRSLFGLAIGTMTIMSSRLLYRFLIVGIGLIGLSALSLLGLGVASMFTDDRVSGFVTMSFALSFILGAQALSVGVVGIYLVRLMEMLKSRALKDPLRTNYPEA